MKSLIAGGVAAFTLLASLGVANAQVVAPENRPSTTMERDGGHSDLAVKATHGRGTPRYLYTGRSVGFSHHGWGWRHHHYRRHYRHIF